MTTGSFASLLGDPTAFHHRFASLTLECVTVHQPESFVPEARTPADFVCLLRADHLTWYSFASRAFVELGPERRGRLIEAADAVSAGGNVRPHVDTAIGRDLTTVTLRVLDPRDEAAETSVRLGINHAAYARPAADPWGAFLGRIFDALAPELDEDDRARLSWLGAEPSASPYR